MTFNIAKIKNIDTSDHSIMGTILSQNEELTIQDSLRIAIASNSTIITKIIEGKLQVGSSSGYISDVNDQINWLKDQTNAIYETLPFASKTLKDGKKLYKRVHGVSTPIDNETKNIDFTVPYEACKITGVELINTDIGDSVNLKVLDTTTGTYTTIANYMLNQFGFNVYLAPGSHKEISQYDADLYLNMQLRIEYTTEATKTVYVNFILHEVK